MHMHKAWKRNQDAVCWVHIRLAQKKGLKFCQTRSNASHPIQYTPSLLYPKATKMDIGEIIHAKVYESLRPPPKISLRDK